MASLKEIRQRVGYAIARAENTIDEAAAQVEHLRLVEAGLTALVEAGEVPSEPEPPPVEGPGGHEPAGMTELFAFLGGLAGPHPFDAVPPVEPDRDAYGWSRKGGNLFAADPADYGMAPTAAGGGVLIGRWPENKDGGSAPFNVWLPAGRLFAASMYWRFRLYLPGDFVWHQQMTKGWWMSHAGHTNHFVAMNSNLGGGFGFRDAFPLYLQFNPADETRPAPNLYYAGVHRDGVPTDRWFTVECLFARNSAGDAADGVYRCWLDGTLVADHGNVHYFSPHNFEVGEAGFNRVQWNPTWGGGLDTPNPEQYAGLDDWYVSFSDAAPEPTPEPEPEPEPTPEPDLTGLTLVHEFSPAAGEPIPDGVLIREGGNATREPGYYEMVYPAGFVDGRGPGRIGIEPAAVPQGHRRLMVEYDIEISSPFEDHPVYTKIAHYRTEPPPDGSAAKFIDSFRDGGRMRLHSNSYTATRADELDQPYAKFGYYGTAEPELFHEPSQRRTVRVLWEWLRQDTLAAGASWYRCRWWIEGGLQGDRELPMFGGPAFTYWEIAPTWGGNSGQVKARRDWMRIYRVATWVG